MNSIQVPTSPSTRDFEKLVEVVSNLLVTLRGRASITTDDCNELMRELRRVIR